MGENLLGKDHMLSSGAVSVIMLFGIDHDPMLNHPWVGAGFIGATLVGSVLPDLDSKDSKVTNVLHSKIYKHAIHRGFLHSIWFWIIFAMITHMIIDALLGWCHLGITFSSHTISFTGGLWLGLVMGYLLHIIEDYFSAASVLWFYPLGQRDVAMWDRYHSLLAPVKYYRHDDDKKIPFRHWWGRGYITGGRGEKWIVYGLWICAGSSIISWIVLIV